MLPLPCLILLSSILQLVWAGKSSLSATFNPGKLGIGAEWSTGEVNRIDKGGQGEKHGVQVGMTFYKIDGEPYSEALLDSKIAGDEDYKISFKKKTPPPKVKPKKDQDEPDKPEFKYAVELDHKSFKEKVYKVTNGTTDGPPYFPVVMFHVSWCKHCRHSLPEFEKAAKMVDEAQRSGHYAMHRAPPKLFLIECDLIEEHTKICDLHVKSNFPVIKLFRDQRALHFNRPRVAGTFFWWAGYVSRPPIYNIAETADMKKLEEQGGPVFVLSADNSYKNPELFDEWFQVALDNIEDQRCAYAPPNSGLSKTLPPAPSVSVKGKGYDEIPLHEFGGLDREGMAKWINFNQFKPLNELDAYSSASLTKSNLVVITLLYRGDKKVRSEGTSAQLLTQFASKAKQLRKNGRYVFAELDLTKEGNIDFVRFAYPPLDPSLSPPPLIFAFRGKDTYWERPSFSDPAALSEESIEELLADSEALQDGSTFSWFKEQRKKYFRQSKASFGDTVGLLIAGLVPIVGSVCLCWCCRALCTSEDDVIETSVKAKKED